MMKKAIYMAPAIKTEEMELQPLMDPSITATGGDAGVGKADPTDPIPGTANGRQDIWTDSEDMEESF